MSSSSPIFISNLSEERWIQHITQNYSRNLGIHPCVFQVPRTMKDTKPEAYTPQVVGLGPYHHFRPEVQQMESRKRNAVKEYIKRDEFEDFIKLVSEMTGKEPEDMTGKKSEETLEFEPTIRSSYDRYLDLDGKTLSWIIVVDGIFLLHVVNNYLDQKEKQKKVDPHTELVPVDPHIERLVPEILMMENQIPLKLLKQIKIALKESFNEATDIDLSDKFSRFYVEQSPLKLSGEPELKKEAFEEHMLHYMYQLIVGNSDDPDSDASASAASRTSSEASLQEPIQERTSSEACLQEPVQGEASLQEPAQERTSSEACLQEPAEGEASLQEPVQKRTSSEASLQEPVQEEPEKPDEKSPERCSANIRVLAEQTVSQVTDAFKVAVSPVTDVFKQVAVLTESEANDFVKLVGDSVNSGYQTVLSAGVKVPNNIQKAVQILQQLRKNSNLYDQTENPVRNILVQKIDVPSVSQLQQILKMKFVRTDGGIRNVLMDWGSNTLYLPVITLRANSEVVLRNLMAYEVASAKPGSTLELTEYVDLMCGIIDTAKDVELLKNQKIIEGDLHPDDIVSIFNGINKSTETPDEKSRVQKIVQDVKENFGKKGIVKAYNFIKKILARLQGLIKQLFPILVLLLLTLQYICDVRGCSSRGLGYAAVSWDPSSADGSLSLDSQANYLVIPRKMLRYSS